LSAGLAMMQSQLSRLAETFTQGQSAMLGQAGELRDLILSIGQRVCRLEELARARGAAV